MTIPRVVMLSFWRNDADRRLEDRARHLLAKTYPLLRWVWVVGDSDDVTANILRALSGDANVQVIEHTTGYTDRYMRLSTSANLGIDRVQPDDDYVFIHESDLVSPPDVVERLLSHGKMPIAAWPTITLPDFGKAFYDIWGFRKDGMLFSNLPPFHPAYLSQEVFEVDSVGSCWMFHAADARAGVRMGRGCAVEMCQRLRWRGRRIWVDPTTEVEQPVDLWVRHSVRDAPLVNGLSEA